MSPITNQLSAFLLAALAATSVASPMPQTTNPVPAVRQSQCVSKGVSTRRTPLPPYSSFKSRTVFFQGRLTDLEPLEHRPH